MTGQSTWVCSGLPFEVCKLRLEEYGVNIFRAVVGSSSNSISLGRTPELLVFGLRVCVGLGSSDRSLGLGFSYKLEVAGQHANGPGLFLMIHCACGSRLMYTNDLARLWKVLPVSEQLNQ